MADVSIGNLYPTKIPAYEAAADIQAALRTYHYGSSTYTVTNENTSNLVNPSIAYYLKQINDSIAALQALGAGGSVSGTIPTSVPEGFIWVDSSSSPNTSPTNPTAIYTTSEPSTPTDGTLWVVKGSSPLSMKIYDSGAAIWRTIGA